MSAGQKTLMGLLTVVASLGVVYFFATAGSVLPSLGETLSNRLPQPQRSQPSTARSLTEDVTIFARRCGRYLRAVEIDRVLDLPTPNRTLYEYRDSMVELLSIYGLYMHAEAGRADVLRAYQRHAAAIGELTGFLRSTLEEEECHAGTILGSRWHDLRRSGVVRR